MEPQFTLKPDLELLSKYGYTPKVGFWYEASYGDSLSNLIHVTQLVNIPGESIKVYENLRTVCRRYRLTKMADTLIFLCLDQADWFYTNLHTAFENFRHRTYVKELAFLLDRMDEIKDGKRSGELEEGIEIQLKKGSSVLAKITRPELLCYIKDTLTKHVLSIGISGGVVDGYETNPTTDRLKALSNIKIKSPHHLENKLSTVFIAKLQEFIAQETHLKTSIASFTIKQRNLIYELGLQLGIFPKRLEGTESDYIKHIYRDNAKLFTKLAKGGRVKLF